MAKQIARFLGPGTMREQWPGLRILKFRGRHMGEGLQHNLQAMAVDSLAC